jgi:hypothetical protein
VCFFYQLISDFPDINLVLDIAFYIPTYEGEFSTVRHDKIIFPSLPDVSRAHAN